MHSFTGSPDDGARPGGGVIFDQSGNLYLTTGFGGANDSGTVYQLSPPFYYGSILYSFQGGSDGAGPAGGVIFDQSGNLYGATTTGGSGGGGTVFELTPSGSGWTFTLIYSFTGGAYCGPRGNLVMDGAGNLYGTTRCDGTYNQGSVFKLTPSSGGWTESDLYDFTGGSDGGSPFSKVVIDANGNL